MLYSDLVHWQLRFGETADKQPIFIETAALFNDRNMNSGGLVIQHEVFDRKDINPEVVGPGILSDLQGYKMFNQVKSYYSNTVLPKWEASGRHNGRDIALFCNDDPDIIALHAWIAKLDNPELASFFGEGASIPNGFDSVEAGGIKTPSSLSTPSANAPSDVTESGNKRNRTNKIFEEMNQNSRKKILIAESELQISKATHDSILQRNKIACISVLYKDLRDIGTEMERRKNLPGFNEQDPGLIYLTLMKNHAYSLAQLEELQK